MKLASGVIKRIRLLPGSIIVNVDLAGADLAGWQAPGVICVYSDLSGTTLRGSDLSGACFDHGSLEKAELGGAKLRGLYLDGTAVGGAKFRDADLEKAVLACVPGMVGEGCDVVDDAQKLDLRGARLAQADIAAPLDQLGADLSD